MTTKSNNNSNKNHSIQSHFAVLCVMEDLIGSADAESESSVVEARARAIPQLSALACTMGRDWCENEIVPFLERVAREDEKAVSVAATEQIPSLCETRYFEQSAELQNELLLRVGVDFLVSSHAEVREAALDAVRRACTVISCQNHQRGKPDTSCDLAPPASCLRSSIVTEACSLLLHVVRRLIFDSGFPAAMASALCLLAPSKVDLVGYRCNPGQEIILSPLVHVVQCQNEPEQQQQQGAEEDEEVRQEFVHVLSKLLVSNGDQQQQQHEDALSQLRMEAAICGGTGRVTLVDQALMRLLSELVSFSANKTGSRCCCHCNEQHVEQAAGILLAHLGTHVFSAPCPSAIFLDTALPHLCTGLVNFSCSSSGSSSRSSSDNNNKMSRLAVRVLNDWTRSEDWAVRFEIAKFSPQLFEALLRASCSSSSSSATVLQELALDLLQHTLPRLVNDDEVEVSTAAAGSLPLLMSIAETTQNEQRQLQQKHQNHHHFSLPALPPRLSDVFDRERLSAPSVQEAVAHALGDTVRGNVEQQKNQQQQQQQQQQQISSTAHNTLVDMLATAEDDTVRVQVVESLLWSAAIPKSHHKNSTTPTLLTPNLESALRRVIHSLLADTASTRWRTRERLASSLGKMLVHILQLVPPSASTTTTTTGASANVGALNRIVLGHAGCFEFVVEPFVRLLLDRFYQVRTTALGEIVAPGLSRAQREPLWEWVVNLMRQHGSETAASPLSAGPGGAGAGAGAAWPSLEHYHTRVARLTVAAVCASEPRALQVLEEASRDKIPNVRRAAAQALSQGCGQNRNNSNNTGSNSSKQQSSEGSPSDTQDMRPSRELVQNFSFSWGSVAAVEQQQRQKMILEMLERLVGDESSDVRESAAVGLARCA